MSKDPQSLPPEKLPQVTAFQDEFTRKFMDSTEPVKEGYYLFRSGVGGYTMLFPEGAKLSEKGYSAPDKFYEEIDFGTSENNVDFYVHINYIQDGSASSINIQLKGLSSTSNYNGEFDKIKLEDKEIYLAKNEFRLEDEKDTAYNFSSYIKSNNSNKGIRFFYSVTCFDKNKPCHLNVKEEEKKAKMLMELVTFIEE
ncbi:hypothetical protein [Numidum massiliense]|uniref:hypothetical protein n=1 Tax=Numidum massiliense TaxID=1522315 RepID=UPI0006D57575|nr:hypothetical protein [Numidum massiliense]